MLCDPFSYNKKFYCLFYFYLTISYYFVNIYYLSNFVYSCVHSFILFSSTRSIEIISSKVCQVIWLCLNIILVYFEGKIFNRMTLASSSSTRVMTSNSFLMRDCKLLIWFDIVIPSSNLKIIKWSFKENFALTNIDPINFFKLSQIFAKDLSNFILLVNRFVPFCKYSQNDSQMTK